MARREFQFKDTKSDKFWIIERDGCSYTVSFGRTGTAGQTKEKSFDSEEKALAEYEKQIASKVKKGYSEVGAGAGSGATTAAPETARKQTASKKATRKTRASTREEAPAGQEKKVEAPLELQRRIDLQPVDRFAVSWEDHEPLERPSPPPYDFDDCIQRLEKCASGYYFDLGRARIPVFPSPQEAQFWILACQSIDRGRTFVPQQVAAKLRKAKIDGEMSQKEKLDAIDRNHYSMDEKLFPCFVATSSIQEICEIATATTNSSRSSWARLAFEPSAFRRFVLPFLSTAELDYCRKVFGELVAGAAPSSDPITSHQLAAAVGCHAETQRVVAALADGRLKNYHGAYGGYYSSHEWLLFGLPDRQQVISEARRLLMNLCSAESVRAWLALTEFEALDVIASSVAQITNKADAARLAKPIGCVVAPEMAAPTLHIATETKAAQVGHEWLAKNPLETAVGLAPLARGNSQVAKAAREQLSILQRGGQAGVLETATQQLEPADAQWLRREIIENEESSLESLDTRELPRALADAFAAVKNTKLPVWLSAATLPPIKLGSKRLADLEVEALLRELKATPVGEASPLLTALAEHAEPNSLDTFAWRLFETWVGMGANTKEKWAMGTIGHLGGDSCVLNLTPLVRQWPGESQHQRAVFGLQCLRGIGSETALMALNGIALKLKFKGLKEKAKEAMEEIARARGMTRDELADRIVPDCGLDESGSREFDFGPRQFKFVLAGESKPMVRDAAGKVRANLPKPNKSDDPDKAEAALIEWKVLKKTLRETLKIQAERLENAMITGRRWTPQNLERFVINHPFMVNLARQLVFAAYDDEGQISQTFRVTEDRSIADQHDDDAQLPQSGTIGIVHPAHLDEPTKSAWGEVLADYGIIPPFQQLGRTICKPEPGDLSKDEITRFKGPKIPGIVMYGMLERSHWLRDMPADGGGFSQHSKHFEASDVTAFIAYDPGLAIGWYDEEQQLTSIYFVRGHAKPEMWGHHKNRAKIGEIDPVVISEVLRLAHAIVAKADS